jgi:hypothetical protein
MAHGEGAAAPTVSADYSWEPVPARSLQKEQCIGVVALHAVSNRQVAMMNARSISRPP